MDNLTELLINFDAGEVSTQALVDWATSEIGRNNESEYLNELAWLSNPGESEARELFLRAIEELNYSLPSYSDRKLLLAKKVAGQMASGNKDLNEGCSELCEISRGLDNPRILSVFELLAHEQYDHESIGINSDNIKPSILEEVNRLINET